GPHRSAWELEERIVNADGDPTIVGDRLQSQISIGLVRQPDVGFEVRGKEVQLLEAGALPIEENAAGELALVGDSLEERAKVGPVGEEKGANVDEDLA